MEVDEAEIEEDDAGDGVRPQKRDDILYFWRTAKEFMDMVPKLNPRQFSSAASKIGSRIMGCNVFYGQRFGLWITILYLMSIFGTKVNDFDLANIIIVLSYSEFMRNPLRI